jgi:uncharacterized protein YcbX
MVGHLPVMTQPFFRLRSFGMPKLARISISPVKGLHLLHPAAVELDDTGIPTDRRFFLVGERGELVDAADHGPLLRVVPEYEPAEERLRLTFPDGTVVEGPADRLGPSVVTDVYGRAAEGRRVLGPFDGALSEFAARPVGIARTDRDGAAQDAHPLTVVSTASVHDLSVRGGRGGQLDARRFRINLEVDGTGPYEEDTWARRPVRIGDATVRVLGQIPRCVVTTLGPDTGQKDFATLRVIAGYRPRIGGRGGLPFGMYAEVAERGAVRVGAEVEVLRPSRAERPGAADR